MYSLYQSPIWKTLQIDIYRKQYGFVNLFWKDYFYLVKEKKVLWFTLREFQIMWLEIPEDNWNLVRRELKKLKKQYWKSRWNIFFQLGIVNEITSFDNAWAREQNIVGKVKSMRMNVRKMIKKETWLRVSFKENMPQTTIMINLKKSDQELLKEMNNGCADRVKKAIKKGVLVREWTLDDYETFFEKWQITAWWKGFSTITKSQYDKLIRILTKTKRGNMFVSELDWDIIAWSICLFHQKTIVYLYWFTDRKYTNLWWHHYLKYGMFERARDHGFEFCDLMWGAPTGFPDHPLVWVSKFKESLWGMKWEFYWNYDLVLNPFLYYSFKFFTWLKKKLNKEH